jgi:hypothetical protein|tara:strand:- start:208 stop:642 length:435 start_codon:yes stop_codon:yes gene_type:complete
MYYIGTTPSDVAAGFIKRYFYGLRRNDDGELFLQQLDQLRLGQENVVIVNDLGIASENYPDFEEGIDFLDGIDIDHEQLYPNLRYQQFKWENRSLLYYIEESTGFFIQRISEAYTYPDKNSSPGYGAGDDSLVLVNSSSEQIGY